MAVAFGPSFCSSGLVPKSKLLHSLEAQSGFVPKHSPHGGKNIALRAKKTEDKNTRRQEYKTIVPWLDLGGTMTVWLKGQNPEDFREHFAIYLYQSDTEIDTDDIKSKFVDADGNLQSGVETLVSETEVTTDFLYYIADLSNYNGKSYVPLP